jgi:hypothetical protein
MAKYRVEFEDKQIRSVQATEQEIPDNDTFLEERTGRTIWAIIEASSEEEARTKAGRLETELQTGKTKRELEDENKDARSAP